MESEMVAAALVVLIGSQASPARQTLATRGVSAQALIACVRLPSCATAASAVSALSH